MTRRALVTGATGFIGAAITRRLIADGWHVTAQTRHAANATDLAAAGADVVEADLRRPGTFDPHIPGHDAVFHTAALVDLIKPARDKILRVNVEGTRHLMARCLAEGVPRVLYLSSVAAIGRHDGVVDENAHHPGRDYSTLYEESKHRSEQAVLEIARAGLDVVLVNPSVVIGPGDPKTGAAFKALLRRQVPAVPRRDGTYNLVHIDDLVDGILHAFERGTPGERYIFNQAMWTTSHVLQAFHEATGVRPPRRVPLPLLLAAAGLEEARAALLRRPARVGRRAVRLAARQYGYSSRKSRGELGWDPAPFEDRFRDTLRHWQREVTVRAHEDPAQAR